jgi:hypothetical protein
MGWSLRTNHYTQRVIGEIYENIIQYLHIYMISMYYLLIDSVTRQKSGSVGPFHGRHDFTRIQARHPQPLLEGWIGEPRLFWGVMIFRAFWDTSLRVVGVFFYAMQKWEFFLPPCLVTRRKNHVNVTRVDRKDKKSVEMMDFVQLLWKSPDFWRPEIRWNPA